MSDPNAALWRQSALCFGHDPDLWFPLDSDGGVSAVAICSLRPVRFACLDWAIEHNERNGIWGGVSARRRQRMRAEARQRAPVVTRVHAVSKNRVRSLPTARAGPSTHRSVESVDVMPATARRSKGL